MRYGDFKDLPKKAVSDKVLRDKPFNIPKNPKCDGYQRGLLSRFCKFFDNKSSGIGVKIEIMSNQQLADELHKPIIRKFENRKLCSSFKDNIWCAGFCGYAVDK